MTVQDFLTAHRACPEQLSAKGALSHLLEDMDLGLAGQGRIPMLPSYLSGDISVAPGRRCCVLDAGGTTLRTALAIFEPDGRCRLEQLQKVPMPGTQGELSAEQFYAALAAPLHALGSYAYVGFCFSYNVSLGRELDGPLDFWCKEVRVPEAVGMAVGASLKEALGSQCRHVHVLNDSVAAMLGAGDVQVGVILGTGINVCYTEQCRNISKIKEPLNADAMIISTEVGEFDQLPKSDFEAAVISRSDAPGNAQAEKQCSGGYLGDIITMAWNAAAKEGLLSPAFRHGCWTLAQISGYLAGESGSQIPSDPAAVEIARAAIHRAAKIAAILCAGPICKVARTEQPLRITVEGSQYWKLTGFREWFHQELDALLLPLGIRYEIVLAENACLIGAARAAFARRM